MPRNPYRYRQQVFARAATAFLAIHFAIALLHDLAHRSLGVDLNLWQNIFVNAVIIWAPVVAVLMMWTRAAKAGAALFAFSMAGAFLFGLAFHFMFESPDHVGHLPPGELQGLFTVTAILLAITQALGAGLGAWAWLQLRGALSPAPA